MVNLHEREGKILEYWKSVDIWKKMTSRNKGAKKFYYLDGPPNAYGLATHHMWVYTIKDIVLKYRRYAGYDVHDRPGFDVHGLPIENKIERKLQFKSKADIEGYGVGNFVKACKDYVDGEIAGSIELLKRFGVFMDFDHTYVPYRVHYISKGWGIFKSMYEKGLLYKDLKPLAYCAHCGTVLSAQGPEVEYADETDKSVYVRYKVKKSPKLELPGDTYLVIWTTTPWTLPAYMAIAVNPVARYVLVQVDNVNYIVAKDRLEAFAKALDKSTIHRQEFMGSELEGTTFTSPLEAHVPFQKSFNKYHRVLTSEKFVTVTEGTGLLHVAPGHGPEDYVLAKANKIPVFSPVDAHARYTAEAGKFAGLSVPVEANEAVMKELKESGDLMHVQSITHTYPHCWRCHSKLIWRATDQWFINISKMKRRMLAQNRKIRWVPEFAQKWFADAIESSPDWCISRQRFWASPIPIWICGKCGEMEVLGSVDELAQRTGHNRKYEDMEIHKPHIDNITFSCRKCNGTMKRVPDVFDVWYDSGTAHTASLSDEEFGRLYPADWIQESLDQIRGWFMTLLRTGVGAYGKTPFRTVMIGGMMKDAFGDIMHRSKGNAVSPEDIINLASVDGWRLFCSARPRWQDLLMKEKDIIETNNNVMTLHNIAELVSEFGELSGVDLREAKAPGKAKLALEDRWILSRFNTLIGEVTDAFDNYQIDKAVNLMRDFFLEDFSRFYLKLAKQRASDAKRGELKRLANLSGYITKNLAIMLSVPIPFTGEHIYQQLFAKGESVFMERWPKQKRALVDSDLERQMEVAKEAITALLNSREKASVSLRWPVAKETLELTSDEAYSAAERLSALIESYTNAKKLELKRIAGARREVRPVFAKLGPSFKERANAVAAAMKSVNADELMAGVEKSGHYTLHTEKGTVDVMAEHFTVVEMAEGGDAVAFKYGKAAIDPNLTEELKAEALVREFERRVQLMRKELKLKKTDRIRISYLASGMLEKALDANRRAIEKSLNAHKIGAAHEEGGLTRDFEIEGETVKVSIKKSD